MRDKYTDTAAQLWCLPQHGKKEMDTDFAYSIAAALRQCAEEAREAAEKRVDELVESLKSAVCLLSHGLPEWKVRAPCTYKQIRKAMCQEDFFNNTPLPHDLGLEKSLAQANELLDEAVDVLKSLKNTDPVYGPVRFVEPKKNPLDFDEKPVYTSRRICALCRRKSGHQGENVTHTMECPWIPAKALLAKIQAGRKP